MTTPPPPDPTIEIGSLWISQSRFPGSHGRVAQVRDCYLGRGRWSRDQWQVRWAYLGVRSDYVWHVDSFRKQFAEVVGHEDEASK